MTTDNINRIPVPSFEQTLQQLLLTAQTFHSNSARHSYVDNLGRGHDLVGTVLLSMGADVRAFEGRRDSHIIAERGLATGTPWSRVRLPLIWDRVFDSDAMFLGMVDDDKLAENYAVYALLSHVQKANDRSDVPTWIHALKRGITTFRSFFFSPSSGFALQVTRHPQGKHQDPRPTMVGFMEDVDKLTSKARQATIATIKEQYK